MRHDPEATFEDRANNLLRPDKVDHLKQKFPRSNYQSTSEWAEAVIREVQSFLPTAEPNFDALGLRIELRVAVEEMRQGARDSQLFLSVIHASEFIEHDLNLRERLDGRIAKWLRYRVIHVKVVCSAKRNGNVLETQ
jgi:hypothetical protein